MSDEFDSIVYDLAKRQAENISDDKPTVMFLKKLMSLIEGGQACVVERNYSGVLPGNFIGYENEEYYYLNKDLAHRAVRRLCEEQGEAFSISERALLKMLADEELIDINDCHNTKCIRIGSRMKRVIALRKDKVNEIVEGYV